MPGPWEKYAQAEPQSGPWSKYSAPAQPAEQQGMGMKALVSAAFPTSSAPPPNPIPFPMSYGVLPKDVQYQPPGGGGIIGDALSLPTRATGAAAGTLGYSGATGGKTGLETLADPETGIMRPARTYLEKQISDAWAGGDDGQRGLGDLAKIGASGLGYVASSIIEDPTALAGIGAGPARKVAGEATNKIMKIGEKVSNIPNKMAGKMAQELSSVSEEALRMAGTKQGRLRLQANAGKEYEIGQRLVHMMDNHELYAANKAKIDKALKGMGEVDLMPVVKELQKAKIQRPSGKLFPHEKTANDAIQAEINALLGKNGRTTVSAAEAMDLRRGMDKNIDFKAPEGKLLDNAKKKGRLAFKELLEKKAASSGNPEYIEGMKSWSKQLDARDRLEAFLGKNKSAQEDRAEAFISNLWGKNKRNRQRIMGDIGELFGNQFLEESKLANLSAQLGAEGKASLFSRATTGRSKLGGALLFPLASPFVASRVTLPLMELPPKGFRWLQKLSSAKTPAEKAFYKGNLKKIGLSDESIAVGVANIEPPKTIPDAPSKMEPPKKITEKAPEAAFHRRIQAVKYLTETTGKTPTQAEVYKFIEDLKDGPIPKIPEKPKVKREFNGRRDDRTLKFLSKAIKEGVPDTPTKTMQAKDAPASFTLQGTEFKRVKGKYDNVITYKDAQGQTHLFREDEVIHMDYGKDEVPF